MIAWHGCYNWHFCSLVKTAEKNISFKIRTYYNFLIAIFCCFHFSYRKKERNAIMGKSITFLLYVSRLPQRKTSPRYSVAKIPKINGLCKLTKFITQHDTPVRKLLLEKHLLIGLKTIGLFLLADQSNCQNHNIRSLQHASFLEKNTGYFANLWLGGYTFEAFAWNAMNYNAFCGL